MQLPHSLTKKKVNTSSDLLGQVLDSRLLIFAMLFGVTGFLGLPVLWFSPRFSRREKYFWSVVNILYTSALIVLCAAICWWSYHRIVGNE